MKKSITIIPVPTASLYIDHVYEMEVNEYTVRNLQLEVKQGLWDNHLIEIEFKGKKSTIQPDGYVKPKFEKGFYDVNYELSMGLLN